MGTLRGFLGQNDFTSPVLASDLYFHDLTRIAAETRLKTGLKLAAAFAAVA